MSQELARKRPATILSAEPLRRPNLPVPRPAVPAPVLRTAAAPLPAPRPWRPDLWPAYIWVPLLCAPGAILAYVLANLALWIGHTI